MKFVFALIAAFCLSVASAASLPKPSINDQILVDIKVREAQLKNSIKAVLKVYIVDAKQSLQLPLTSEELKGHQNIEYYSLPKDISAMPKWDSTYGFPSAFFNLNSYIVVEIWNQLSESVKFYVGGAELTVGSLKAFPNTFTLVLYDENKQNAGSVLVDWAIPSYDV